MTSVTTTSTSRPSSSSGRAPRLPAEVDATDRARGDLNDAVARSIDTAWATQVHGAAVLVVDAPGWAGEADALVTTTPGLRLAVRAADCGTLVLTAAGGPRPCLGVAHAGWRGARAGVVAAAAAEVRRLSGADDVLGWLGPCIGPCCYAFGEVDLADVAAELGADVRATTTSGGSALDLPRAVGLACAGAGVRLTGSDGRCTACAVDGSGQPVFFSHRARGDVGRHGVLACLR